MGFDGLRAVHESLLHAEIKQEHVATCPYKIGNYLLECRISSVLYSWYEHGRERYTIPSPSGRGLG